MPWSEKNLAPPPPAIRSSLALSSLISAGDFDRDIRVKMKWGPHIDSYLNSESNRARGFPKMNGIFIFQLLSLR